MFIIVCFMSSHLQRDSFERGPEYFVITLYKMKQSKPKKHVPHHDVTRFDCIICDVGSDLSFDVALHVPKHVQSSF